MSQMAHERIDEEFEFVDDVRAFSLVNVIPRRLGVAGRGTPTRRDKTDDATSRQRERMVLLLLLLLLMLPVITFLPSPECDGDTIVAVE